LLRRLETALSLKRSGNQQGVSPRAHRPLSGQGLFCLMSAMLRPRLPATGRLERAPSVIRSITVTDHSLSLPRGHTRAKWSRPKTGSKNQVRKSPKIFWGPGQTFGFSPTSPSDRFPVPAQCAHGHVRSDGLPSRLPTPPKHPAGTRTATPSAGSIPPRHRR
jgi:hypothetical protein